MDETQAGENPLFGRKVFFLNPAYSVRTDVVNALHEQEYEVYVIDNWRDSKNIMRLNSDSLLFINVDSQLSKRAWFNFIASFQLDETLSTIHTGLISKRLKSDDQELVLSKAKIQAGIILLTKNTNGIIKQFSTILEKYGAKGRRQYVRANCQNEKNAVIMWNEGSKLYEMKIMDLSTVGTAVLLPLQFKDLVKEKSIMRNLILMIGSKQQLQVSAVVYAVKPTANGIMLVLLFIENSLSTKSAIRTYVFSTLQKSIASSVIGLPQDNINYNRPFVKYEGEYTPEGGTDAQTQNGA